MPKIKGLTQAHKRLLCAIVAGVAAAALLFSYAGNLEAQAASARSAALTEYGGSRVEVLVATRDLVPGEQLDASNTELVPWLADLLPQGALTQLADAAGATLGVPVWRNEPLTMAKLGGTGEAIEVPAGLVALSIPLSNERAVGGSLLRGSAVDVYAVGAVAVRLVAADVLVLEASNGGTAESQQAGAVLGSSSRTALKWVTLAVSEELVAELLAAARDNQLALVLPGDGAGGGLGLSSLAPDDFAAADSAAGAPAAGAPAAGASAEGITANGASTNTAAGSQSAAVQTPNGTQGAQGGAAQ